MGSPDKARKVANQINETKPSMILLDVTQGPIVLEAIRHSTHAMFNSRILSIGYLNDRCHNILNLIRNVDTNFAPDIAHPVDPLLVHWSRGEYYTTWGFLCNVFDICILNVSYDFNVNHYMVDLKETKTKKKLPCCEMIRHDTMKEILGQSFRDTDSGLTNIVSTIQPSQIDGLLNGLSILLHGRGGYYQV